LDKGSKSHLKQRTGVVSAEVPLGVLREIEEDGSDQRLTREIGPGLIASYSWTSLCCKFVGGLSGRALGLFLLTPLFESDASNLWQNPSLRVSWVPKREEGNLPCNGSLCHTAYLPAPDGIWS
jgi:hypothetical protein